MPGAGSLRAANFLYEVAPKDGTALGTITQSVALEEALGTPGARFKAAEFTWLGRVTTNVELTLTRQGSAGKTIQDVMTREIPVAGTGPGLASVVYPTVLNNIVGTKFNVVTGYSGSNESMLAMERGEVDGALTSWNSLKTTQKAALDEKRVNLLVQYTLEKHPDLPHVPTMVELARNPEDRQVLALYASGAAVGRAIMAPPNLVAGRTKVLRDAFDAMLTDAAFLDDIEKTKAEFDPLSGEKLAKLIADTANVPDAVRERARAARGL
jgi:tripartite-type tricarboxylate transporter receptor subunit TctC